ncbi:adenylate/guanylate cyclase domain-containing protein [Ferrovibrio sp.]|uniref:adenylate/guanylate cyclase domain-containing protein n=1 Tax=Ferrovibrio sp. TaxID=1917215 RepID=UPI003D29AA56
MALSNRRRRQVVMLLRFICIGSLAGALYGLAIDSSLGGDSARLGFLRGLITGGMVTFAIAVFEIFYATGPSGQGLRRLPFMRVALIKTVLYSFFIVSLDGLGNVLVPIEDAEPTGFNSATLITLVAALGFTFVVNTLMQINLLLGRRVLKNFIKGRYHHPRLEQRLFLFLDMRGSTAIAERIGDIAFHKLLNQFFSDLGEAVEDHEGSIEKYVGDEMIVTWPSPVSDARAVATIFSARDLLQRRAAFYAERLGAVPDFRAVLHAGPVVVGEMGDFKREIALLGDTINTTAKIEQWAKGVEHTVIASRAALDAMGTLEAVTAIPLGAQTLPGKAQPLELFALQSEQK